MVESQTMFQSNGKVRSVRDIILDPSEDKVILSRILKDLQAVSEYVREDWDSEAARLATEELKAYLEKDSCLDCIWDDEIKTCLHIGGLAERYFLIRYKGFGFVLADIGNSNWVYAGTVEQLLMSFSANF